MILAAAVVFGLLAIAIGLTTDLWVFLALMFATGVAVPFFSTPATTLLQEKVAPEYMGRVFSFVSVVLALGMPIGMIVFGPLADVVRVETLLVAAGAVTLLVVVGAGLSPDGRAAREDGRAFRAASLAGRGDDEPAGR
jgi:DHA3 family macrolide efflux protein-like MFS transporter